MHLQVNPSYCLLSFQIFVHGWIYPQILILTLLRGLLPIQQYNGNTCICFQTRAKQSSRKNFFPVISFFT